VKSSQKRFYRRERNFAGVFFDDYKATWDKPGFWSTSNPSQGRAVAPTGFSRAMCRHHRNPKIVASPIFVALGDETDMEEPSIQMSRLTDVVDDRQG
jgi:hypothetical protein